MDPQSLTETSKSRKGPLVGEQEFMLIFVCFFERVLNAMISADISNLITLYVGPSKRLGWFNKTVHHSKYILIVDGMNITKRLYAPATVLCGDGEPLNRSRWTKYEVVFRINEMGSCGFYIGYIVGSNQDFDVEERLGVRANKKSSVGICIVRNQSADGPSAFLEQGKIWRVSWDLIENQMEISALNQQETVWIPMNRYAMKEKHRDVIPAFSLVGHGDSITLLSGGV